MEFYKRISYWRITKTLININRKGFKLLAEYVEIYIDQGTDFTTTITINDDDTNLPVGQAGVNVASSLRRSLLSPNVYASFACSVSDPANGEITIAMNSANTSNLRPGRYFFDINTTSAGIKSRLIEGIVIVTPAITG